MAAAIIIICSGDQQHINPGSFPNDGTGDTSWEYLNKSEHNFQHLFDYTGGQTNLPGGNTGAVQYKNEDGLFAGEDDLIWDPFAKSLKVGTTDAVDDGGKVIAAGGFQTGTSAGITQTAVIAASGTNWIFIITGGLITGLTHSP